VRYKKNDGKQTNILNLEEHEMEKYRRFFQSCDCHFMK